MLFDNTHGQTAGAADWVIDGGFSDFGQALASNGYDVHELRQSTPITYNDLKNYDVFVTAEPNIPFKQSEQAAMEQYVKAGNSIFSLEIIITRTATRIAGTDRRALMAIVVVHGKILRRE